MIQPGISIIMPVFNAENQLPKTLNSIQNQTFTDWEVIFIDDGSTDRSIDVLKQAADHDNRIKILQQPHQGAGAARNSAISHARGCYTIFSDCDDIYQPNALELLYAAASSNDADIVACNYAGLDTKNNVHQQYGLRGNALPADCTVFDYQDCPEEILRVSGPMVWNKLYKTDFIIQNGLLFDTLFACNDLAFVAVSMACARKICFCTQHLIHYHFPRLGNVKPPVDSAHAIASALTQLNALPNRDQLQAAIVRFGIESYINSLKRNVKDFSSAESQYLYTEARNFFLEKACAEFTPECLHNTNLYREFCTVREQPYETICKLREKKIIVSLTSYPKRIGSVKPVVDTILAQTKPADRIILWLAEEQFPGKENDLPEELVQLYRNGSLDIRWCDDLKPHKKYFYAFQEYPNDLIITVDDDILYPANTISTLYASYLLYPQAVSASRAHIVAISSGKIVPYNNWIHEVNSLQYSPSMQLIATGCGGILYSPSLFRKEFFDKTAIFSTCLHADDLWLKAMQVLSDVPVVLARNYEPLNYVPGSQDDALFQLNIRQNQNDVQLERIIQWADAHFGKNSLLDKLLYPVNGADLIDLEPLLALVERERRIARHHLIQSELIKTELEAKNQILTKEAASAQSKLEKCTSDLTHAQHKIAEMNMRLSTITQQLRASEENKPVHRQLKALKNTLSSQREADGLSFSYFMHCFIYCLAWIPEKILEIMMYYLQNGAKQTLKQIYRKLFRRKP